ncbi:CNH domain-containing protein [Suillus paluster]|uniref:CNH domain-containing protein n=1 Tax=Suillus paluster TaxID=48578 RepID=UPI001B87FFFB|nr:CNH domain-containing protein [Suillus paluster]KAG1748343.1 CNH domain-containing protein [Suillus paluster]
MANPLDVPPYLLQPLIPSITAGTVTCAQAFGTEIYVGCSNGELLRYSIHPDADPTKLATYTLLSQQSLPSGKQIDELILVPCIARALILCDRQVHIYTLPSLDLVPNIKPIRHVEALAVDHNHLQRPAATSLTTRATSMSTNFPTDRGKNDAIEMCVIKRNNIAMFSLGEEKLTYTKDIPFRTEAPRARRSGHHLCIATADLYSIIDLASAQMFELLPVTQVQGTEGTIKPHILVISPSEFLILSWTGGSTLGVFITGEGDPTRGTLQWPAHPVSICLDYPYLTTLLPNGTIEVHSVETQALIQTISAPDFNEGRRPGLVSCLAGYAAPTSERVDKMRKVKVGLSGDEEVLQGHEEKLEEVEKEKDTEVPSLSI